MLPFDIQPFEPLVTGWAGYFLLGCLLDRISLDRRARLAVYLGGAAGYAVCLLGNLAAASPQEIPLPMDNGFFLNHYLLAAALFVFCRSLCATRIRPTGGLSRLLGRLSGLVFGVYWVHVLILYVLTDLAGQELSILAFIALRLAVTIPLSFAISLWISKLPVLRQLLG